MSALPAGEGVGGETGVHHGDGADEIPALQIGIERPQLGDEEHALVDDGSAGHGADVAVGVALLEDSPGGVEPPVEVQTPGSVLRAGDERLLDDGHAGARPLAQHAGVHRYLAPAEKAQPLLLHHDLHQLARLRPLEPVGGQKQHGHAVVPLTGQLKAQRLRAEEGVGNLSHQSYAVAGAAVRVPARAVLQLFHDLQRLIHDGAALLAINADHRADAARVVLHFGQIEVVRRAFLMLHMPHPRAFFR